MVMVIEMERVKEIEKRAGYMETEITIIFSKILTAL